MVEINLNSIEDVFYHLNKICDENRKYNDEDLSDKLSEITNFCIGGNDGKSFFTISHRRSEILVEKRAKKFCKKNKMKLEDYRGPLSYRKFIIDLK